MEKGHQGGARLDEILTPEQLKAFAGNLFLPLGELSITRQGPNTEGVPTNTDGATGNSVPDTSAQD